MNRLKFGILSAVILLLVSGVNASALAQVATPDATETVTFPDLTGPYKVGRTTFEWVDQSRDETLASISGLKRDLIVYVWFPVTTTKRTKFLPYMDGGPVWLNWTARPELESKVHSHTYTSTLFENDKLTYPVLVFSHGSGESSLNYASIIEEIVSHGYIVFGVNHPYNASVISYPDGRLVLANEGGTNLTVSQLDTWTKDTSFVIDQLAKLNENSTLFKGRLDLDHIGVFGHSFGGMTALQVSTVDPRVKAGATLDGGLAAIGLPPAITTKPFLFMGINAQPDKEQKGPDAYWLNIKGMAHQNYGDFALLFPLLGETGGIAPIAIGTIDPARGVQIVDSYLLAFFDHYLKAGDLKWPTYDEASLSALSAN
jgi:dienelactone hydrolase